MMAKTAIAFSGLLALAACGQDTSGPEPTGSTNSNGDRVKNIDKMPGFVQPGARAINDAERLKTQLNQQNQDTEAQIQQETQ